MYLICAVNIFCRWKKAHTGEVMETNGKKILQFLAVKKTKKDMVWELPWVSQRGYLVTIKVGFTRSSESDLGLTYTAYPQIKQNGCANRC